MAQPWSFSFAFDDAESNSEDEDATIIENHQMQGVQFTDQPVEQGLSEDTRLARELDLSTRKDTAIFRKTPWTVAKTNAASRPAIKPSVPSFSDSHALKFSNGSLLTTRSTKRPKEVLQKNLTDHFRRSSSRKEISGSSVERAKTRPSVQQIVTTRPDTPKKQEPSPKDNRPFQQKQPQPPGSRPFISPLKNLLQPPPHIPKSSLPPKQPLAAKVKGLPMPNLPIPIVSNAHQVTSTASATPDRLKVKEGTGPTVKRETVTPTTKKAGDTFRPSASLTHAASFTPLKRKRESSPVELSVALPQRSSSPVHKRVRKEESAAAAPQPVRSTARQVQGALAYGNGAIVSSDERWSTLPTRKKPQGTSMKNSSSSRIVTGGFRLPTSFLGVPKNVENVQGKVRPKMTLLTLYQPPPPLPSTQSREDVDKETESMSDPSEESGSGESDGSAVERNAKSGGQEEDFRFDYSGSWPVIERDNEDTPLAREEDENLDESNLIASIDPVALQARFPRLVNGLRERHRALRVPLWELLGMDSCGVVWDDEWTEEGGAMRIPVLPLQCTDGYNDVPDWQ